MKNFREMPDALRVMAPFAIQPASFEKDRGPDSRAVI
jgi:hypothetical protein